MSERNGPFRAAEALIRGDLHEPLTERDLRFTLDKGRLIIDVSWFGLHWMQEHGRAERILPLLTSAAAESHLTANGTLDSIRMGLFSLPAEEALNG